MPSDEIETLRHLLLSFPELTVTHDGRELIDQLVKGAIHTVQQQRGFSAITTVGDLASTIRTATGLDYETAEIVASLERLENNDHLRFTSPGHDSFVARSDSARQVGTAVNTRLQRDREVREHWSAELRNTYELTEVQVERLWNAFTTFLAKLVHNFAAEAAAFLYIDNADGQVRFYDILQANLPSATDGLDAPLAAIAARSFPQFFRSDIPSRRDYVADRLQVAFFELQR